MHRTAIALAVLAAVMVGCGGGEALTHDEFVVQADKICADANAKFEAALGGLSESSTDDERNDALEEFARAYGDMADDVGELEAPEDDQAISTFVDRLKRNADGFEEAADNGELMSDSTVDKAFNSLQEASAAAEDAGLDDCSTANS